MGDKETISALVDAGNVSAGPPLGPKLGPLGMNIGKVVQDINEATEEFEGMSVPIELTVDTETKEYEIEVGKPPVSALIKEEAGIESGSGEPNENKVANLSLDQIKQIAEMKQSELVALTLESAVKEVIGSCVSMGVEIEGEDGRKIQEKIDNGEIKINDGD